MNKLGRAIHNIHAADAGRQGRAEAVHPLARLLVALWYAVAVVSFDRYDIAGLSGMLPYLLIFGIWDGISVKDMAGRIFPVLVLTGIAGAANPFLDREVYWRIGQNGVTGGMISMATLMLKGIFCAASSYLLMWEIGMEGICYSLRCLHVPKEFVTALLLIYRYLIVLLKEAERMMQAYKLRAPGQRGIHIKTWGAFVGQLLLRSIDRAETVYESMLLRGYHGEFAGKYFRWEKGISISYVLLWGMAIACFRAVPVFELTGNLLQRI